MTEQVRISRTAVASLVLGLLFLFPLIPAVLAVILGIMARRHINRSEGRYLGKGLATAGIVLGAVVLVYWVFLMFSGTVYRVGIDEVAVITRFGAPQKTVSPGLNFKMPFVDKAHRFPVGGYLKWQSTPFECVTAEGQRVTIRAKMRYRIRDPIRYFQTIGSPYDRLAARRLEDILSAEIMKEANKYPLGEFVSSVRNLSFQKNFHSNFSARLNSFGISMHRVDEPYDVLETSLK